MIKIAYVINYIVKNGPSNVVLNLINNLDKSKYKITLITLFDGNDAEVVKNLKKENIEVRECTSINRMGCVLGHANEFEKYIVKQNFDIIHTHGFIPDIVLSRAKVRSKKITTIHNNMYEDYLTSYGYIKSRVYIKLHLRALKNFDKCICCSKSVYDVLNKKIRNTLYIRNGIEPKKAKSIITRSKLKIPDGATVFIFVGALNSRKNIVNLIKKFVKYHNEDEYLLVLGDGEKKNECLINADENVVLLGFQSDTTAYMNISNVYISDSKSEGFSIAVLEALACGLLLFLSDIPSHKEIVEMEQELYIGEIFDDRSFDEKLNKMRKAEIEKNEIIKFQKEKLSAKQMAKEYMKEYEKD